MISDLLHLPDQTPTDVQVFRDSTIASGTTNWIPWRKPKGAIMVQMFAIGGGGGGGNGFTRSSGSNGGGGGGGSAGELHKLLIPASFLPDILHILVGPGGAAASVGTGSFISIQPVSTAGLTILRPSKGNNGTSGTSLAAGSGAATGGNTTVVGMSIAGFTSTSQGQAGANGGIQTGAVGSDVTYFGSSFLCSGGAGGAGCGTTGPGTDFAGGRVLSPDTTLFPTLPGGAALSGGNPGIAQIFKLLGAQTGGSGGGSNNSGTGGKGGDGGIGCGGGGGGAGVTGGAGGRGGPGIAIIMSW